MRTKDEKRIRSYLLGTLSPERAEEFEWQLLKDDSYAEQLSLIEDELIEDYARHALSEQEREQFENYFLSTPRRRRKLMIVRGFRKYSMAAGPVSVASQSSLRPWYYPVLVPWWKPAAALLILLAAVGSYRIFLRSDDVDKGLVALNEAYKQQRSVEVRVTDLQYAPFSPTRGPEKVNSIALDRSAALLLTAASDRSSAKAIHALGRFYLLNREFDKAIHQLEQALKINPNSSRIESDLGAALFEKGKLERANDSSGRSETTLAESLDHLTRTLEQDDSLLDARFNRALLYQELKLSPQALADWEKYLSHDSSSPWADEARRKIEEIRKQSQRISERGQTYFQDFLAARKISHEQKVWQIFRKAHLRTGNLITNKLIDQYLETVTKQQTQATDSLESLTYLATLASDKTQDLYTTDLVHVYGTLKPDQYHALFQARNDFKTAYELYNGSQHDRAISLFSRARTVFNQLGDRPEALLADFWKSYCFSQRGDTEKSISILTEVAAECERRGYKWLQSIAQIGLASGCSRKTQYSEAVDHAWNSYRISEAIEDQNGVLRSLNMLAGLYRDVGNYHQSLQIARKGLDLGTEISADASQMVGFYATSAWSLNVLSQYRGALEYEKQALVLADEMKSPLVRSRYLVQLGLIQGMLKNYDEAIQNIRRGIEISEALGEEKIGLEMSAYGRFFLARTYRATGRFPEALSLLGETERFCREASGQQWLLHEVQKEQLLTLIAKGELVPAREELGRVLAAYEEQRQKILENSNRVSFFEKEQNIYDIAIDFSISSSPEQAFDYSESSRARSLLDAASENWHVTDDEKAPDLRFSTAVKPTPLSQIQPTIPLRAQIVEYAVIKDKLVIWYLSRDRFESTTVNINSDELTKKVNRLVDLVSEPPRDDAEPVPPVAAELYDLLIGPVAQFLDRTKQLTIIPDKALNLLPFNILFSSSSQKYLVENFVLSYAASANLFVRDSQLAITKRVAHEDLLGVGNPSFDAKEFPELMNLPSAAREVEEIRGFYDSGLLLRGSEARKASVLNAIRNADVVHLATHYVPDATSPMLSKLLLASEVGQQSSKENGVLRVYEIYRLKPLRSRLAILAGCRTGVEGYFNGEGPIGLARPFNAAGVPLVIASLWPVDSTATTELLVEFHRRRKQLSLSSAEALQAAQVEMLTKGDPQQRFPYYWASFSLSGAYSTY